MTSAPVRERDSHSRSSASSPKVRPPERLAAGSIRVVVRRPGGVSLLPLGDVESLEADGNTVVVHTVSGEHHRIRESLSHMFEALQNYGFIRVHRGAVVSASAIVGVEKGRYRKAFCVLRSGTRFEIGRVEFHRLRALWQTGVLDLNSLSGLTLLTPTP